MTRPGPVLRMLLALSVLCACCARGANGDDRFFDSDGIPIRYQTFGQGPPVVLIHGFGETLQRWHSTGLVRTLSREFRVIAFDVRGHGRSGKPSRVESYGAELAADVRRLLAEVGASKAHIVGYSMGALVALDIAERYPDQVLSVVLGGAGMPSRDALADFARQAQALEQGQVPAYGSEQSRARGPAARSSRDERRGWTANSSPPGRSRGCQRPLHARRSSARASASHRGGCRDPRRQPRNGS